MLTFVKGDRVEMTTDYPPGIGTIVVIGRDNGLGVQFPVVPGEFEGHSLNGLVPNGGWWVAADRVRLATPRSPFEISVHEYLEREKHA